MWTEFCVLLLFAAWASGFGKYVLLLSLFVYINNEREREREREREIFFLKMLKPLKQHIILTNYVI